MALEDDGVYELYLYTIDVYKRLVGVLPLDDCLARFNPQSFSSEIGNLELGDEALAAVSMRLMLQRKYFARGKDLFLKKLLSAEQDFEMAKDKAASLLVTLTKPQWAGPDEFVFVMAS